MGVGSTPGRLRSLSPMRVATMPGHSTDTDRSVSTSSWCMVSLRATTPRLATLYDAMPGKASSPAVDAVFMMWPGWPSASMRGTKWCTPWMTPHRSMSMTHFQSASEPQGSWRVTTPALLARKCTPPCSDQA